MPYFNYPSTTPVHTTFVHPEYQYWLYHWESIRHALVGEIEVKRWGERYLPKLEGMQPPDYKAYVDRAVFFNMTARTITGLTGTLFRRNPVVAGLPDKLNTSNISKDQQSLMQFAKMAGKELLTVGRFGILVDMDQEGKRPPYLAGYIAENITDWTIREIDGRWVVTEVILRELRLARPIINPISTTPAGRKIKQPTKDQWDTFSIDSSITRAARRWIAAYRVLRLEPVDPNEPNSNLIYRQYYHINERGDASPEGTPYAVYTPTWRGQPFSYIPFVFLGPQDNTSDIDKPPIMDIVTLNYSHYRSYAQLEHGRFYTALPVYYCPIPPGQTAGEYVIGPSVVWEVEVGQKPGIVEFNGQGLSYLQAACDKKEDQIAALGGRMVGVERVSAGQSNNELRLKEANEQAMLLNTANVLDTSFTTVLRWWAMWQDMPPEEAMNITFETNKDFLATNSGAREFRAMQQMYLEGVIPVEVMFDYLRREEVIPDWMSIDEFKDLLNSPNSFPNAVDAQARQRGAPDAKTEWAAEHVLTNPQVVAALGFSSQVPEGQQPLPGQTVVPNTAVLPATTGAGSGQSATGAGGGGEPQLDANGNPVPNKNPQTIPNVFTLKGRGKKAPAQRTAPSKTSSGAQGATPTDIGSKTPLEPVTGDVAPGNRGAGQHEDPEVANSGVVTQ
jgi:hypothetical protein